MSRPTRLTPAQARERILAQAEQLFRKFGFSKTTMADIAGELKMSPSNLYKFFRSKNALVQAGCERCLDRQQRELREVARTDRPAVTRLRDVALAVYREHCEAFANERQIYQLVVTATEESWPCVGRFQEFLGEIFATILRDGIRAGELRRTDIARTTQSLLDSLAWILNPLLFPELDSHTAPARLGYQIRLLERALQAD